MSRVRLGPAIFAFLATVLLTVATSPNAGRLQGTASAAAGRSMAEGGRTMAPLGHIVLCMKHPSQCGSSGSRMSSKQAKAYLERASKRQQKARPPRATLNRSPRQAARHPPVRLTSKRWAELTSVNRRVNRSLIARSDGASHAGLDVWSVSGRYGDCEDFAIRKRDALIRLGWSAHAVLMTVAKTSAGEPHAVLIARTDKGDFVLDNLRPQVTAWQDVPYRWVKRQSQDDPSKWVRLTGG